MGCGSDVWNKHFKISSENNSNFTNVRNVQAILSIPHSEKVYILLVYPTTTVCSVSNPKKTHILCILNSGLSYSIFKNKWKQRKTASVII